MSHQPPSMYVRLARMMNGDKNLAIFRRFDDANILCLLSLQAEILQLQSDFHLENSLDEIGTEEERKNGESFYDSQQNNSDQHQRLYQLRKRLMQYNKFLAQYSATSQLPSPKKSQLQSLRNWLAMDKGGKNFQTGAETNTWTGDGSNNPDLYVTLRSVAEDDDLFTRGFMRFIAGPFHLSFGQRMKVGRVIDEESGYVTYQDARIIRLTSIIVTVIAAILPPLTILVLNGRPTTNQRIGFTVLFTAIFAGILAYFSKAKRVEILVATATFAAVEVVFIGSALSGTEQAQINGNLTLMQTMNGSGMITANLTST
ncbi:uncharacterized protein FSUBG_11455 [Fusarium subglutinans]|uniref:DUF6594 domain-containing protein n=1 Tax=Gibberella subglutinans TaxID=42677 RepID=A0A8H5LBJ0_GIBSU|nr:uncharacterized protein FSUBG_11455 [Fusarium subglutinans]KAF5588598.1 hypothetical protein FSUBG_11455 [Fusarium subglutinans]